MKRDLQNPKKHILLFRINEQELAYIKEQAQKAGISTSAYARQACLNAKIKSITDEIATKELIRECANLGRLGGLFKYWLTAPKTLDCQCHTTKNDRATIIKIIDKIYSTQNLLCDTIDKILVKRNSKY